MADLAAVQAALDFLRTARERPDVLAQIDEPAATSEQLAELAGRLGHPCSAADIDAAFRLDWAMRWARDGRGAAI